jgi:hypothetical protein
LQVLHDALEHEAQLAGDLMRLDPPPIPNEEKSFRTSRLPQFRQQTSCS